MKTTKALAIFAAGVLTLGSAAGLAGCKPSQPQGDLGRATTLYVQLINYTNTADAAYERLATVYNETQGKEDDIEVIIDEQTSVNNYTSQLRPDKTNQYDIMTIDNMTFKEVLVEYFDGANVIVPLDEYLDDPEFAQALGLSDIPETSMDMWKMTQSSDEDGFFYAGAGQPQLALPFFNDPQVLFYNSAMFEAMGINIISVPEDELDAYNSAHGTSLKPHGYAEYTPAAVGGDLADKTPANLDGKQVVKVFNNCIPMNWEELRTVAQQYQKENPGSYGYMSEWWFNYGWSVGGDCIGWNGEQYELSLGDKTKGLLVIDETLTVNGTVYYQGDVLDYEDLHALGEDRNTLLAEKRVAELPSMYDAFVEFNRLGVPTDKNVTDDGVKGYGIAPTTVDDRAGLFSDGKSPMLCEYYATQNAFTAKLGDDFDIAPLAQYREYEGDPYDDGVLKVIGENGYTGDLATAENSAGEKVGDVPSRERRSFPPRGCAQIHGVGVRSGRTGDPCRGQHVRPQSDFLCRGRSVPERGEQGDGQQVRRDLREQQLLCRRLVVRLQRRVDHDLVHRAQHRCAPGDHHARSVPRTEADGRQPRDRRHRRVHEEDVNHGKK